ncbi:MAG: hypothetical protein AB7O97_12710 [Planctomycetota bacterium]
MNHRPLLGVLSLALLAPVAAAQNLLANPSFELGLNGWGAFGNSLADLSNPPSVVPRTGVQLCKMFGNFSGGFNVSGVFQSFPAQPGQTFTLDCWSRQWSGDPLIGGGLPNSNWAVMKIAFFDAGGTEIGNAEQVVLDGLSLQDTWIDNPAVSGTAPPNTTSVQALLLFLQPGNDGGAAQFDDVEFTGPPANPAYPGSAEDVRLSTAVGGGAPTSGPGSDVKQASPGDLLEFNVSSPNGTYTAQNYFLLGSVFGTGAPPLQQLPSLWIDPFSYITLAGGLTTIGPVSIGPNGSSSFFVTPPGLTGLSLMVQGLTISPSANNGVYAATDGHEIAFQ